MGFWVLRNGLSKVMKRFTKGLALKCCSTLFDVRGCGECRGVRCAYRSTLAASKRVQLRLCRARQKPAEDATGRDH
jgi:hypothetical protein